MVIYNPSESVEKTVTVGANEAVVHVVNPIDEFTGNSVIGGEVYISLDGSLNPPFEYIGAMPQDIWFGEGHSYELGKSYRIIVKLDGYIFGDQAVTLNADDDITTDIKVLNCVAQTPNFSTGCELLKHYDSNSDGYHSMDDTLNAIKDWNDGLITLTENLAIVKSWAGDGINYLCPDCFEAVHDTALTINTTDVDGTPITEAFVGDTVYVVGELRDIDADTVLTDALIRLYRNGEETTLTDMTDASGIYSILYTVVSADAPNVALKTLFAGA
jgi:hypothetical protein